QTTWYVDDDFCPGPGSGTVGDPFCSIQFAIIQAVNGDVVIVAHGTYMEAINFLGKAITVRSTDPNDPVVVMQTIIDGTGFLHVVQCVSNEGPNTVLSGFVITGGNANGAFPDNAGGGMYNLNSSPTVTNCSFSGNTAVGPGGGMYNIDSNPTVTNCSFSGNSSVGSGGGMYNQNASFPTVTNTGFCDNTPNAIFGDPIIDGGGNSLNYCPPPIPVPPSCPADINTDTNVNVTDLLALLAAWGACP
ncbi:MAG: hypothetical protein IID30_15800, partial [Planctomycetes bacterium]|nr:hypothetical protein [Planctomycetota bacterium]